MKTLYVNRKFSRLGSIVSFFIARLQKTFRVSINRTSSHHTLAFEGVVFSSVYSLSTRINTSLRSRSEIRTWPTLIVLRILIRTTLFTVRFWSAAQVLYSHLSCDAAVGCAVTCNSNCGDWRSELYVIGPSHPVQTSSTETYIENHKLELARIQVHFSGISESKFHPEYRENLLP